ncbi:hypothetical protein O181_003596 [Austropuccinia psidii MF-1]|uniref:Uncharacterized protein n=1 Tax=Austropuccinia psidii MF-1 TaxID=1389203 RepID=A0A9Q3BF90_9BASI|nr:hypothetical protein [Austropuccinia psidii MF-1]
MKRRKKKEREDGNWIKRKRRCFRDTEANRGTLVDPGNPSGIVGLRGGHSGVENIQECSPGLYPGKGKGSFLPRGDPTGGRLSGAQSLPYLMILDFLISKAKST